jgi:enterochelin esterase family protein
MRFIYLDAGDRDEHGLQFGARQMRDLLVARGAPVAHEEFPGGHRGTGHRYETSLPRLVAACAR